MKKVLSVLLALFLILSAAPFAAAEDAAFDTPAPQTEEDLVPDETEQVESDDAQEDALPEEIAMIGLLEPKEENSQCRCLLVLQERFVAATPSLKIRMSHKPYDEGAAETTDVFGSGDVAVSVGEYLEDGVTVSRLQLLFPAPSSEAEIVTGVCIDAGSLTDASGNGNIEIEVRRGVYGFYYDIVYEVYSKVMKSTASAGSSNLAGVDDEITLDAYAPFPARVMLDGEVLGELRGGESKEFTLSYGETGKHRFSLCYQDLLLRSDEFRVCSQLEIYRIQRDTAYSTFLTEGMLGLVLPLFALPMMGIPMVGGIMLLGPLETLYTFIDAVKATLRVVNLLGL